MAEGEFAPYIEGVLRAREEMMGIEMIFSDDTLLVQYDNNSDTVIFNRSVAVSYFDLEKIMEQGRRAHFIRNNLRLKEDEE